MDKVFIQGLNIQTTIGFFEWEKQIKQTLVIDLEMLWDIKPAAERDELAKTLDYAQISEAIAEFANNNPVDLLETLAERMAQFLMTQYQIPGLKLRIGKPNAVHNAFTVGVEIERGSYNNG
ncbi:dihydroneopterin aldolase [Thalassotalea euphylliae]|uniref:dihydroneopterin aldolase n=1 Tax=Thalassotalea euphylliae TaxID=1655234 RepID=UPI00363A5CAB